jgi:hypothetical protein
VWRWAPALFTVSKDESCQPYYHKLFWQKIKRLATWWFMHILQERAIQCMSQFMYWRHITELYSGLASCFMWQTRIMQQLKHRIWRIHCLLNGARSYCNSVLLQFNLLRLIIVAWVKYSHCTGFALKVITCIGGWSALIQTPGLRWSWARDAVWPVTGWLPRWSAAATLWSRHSELIKSGAIPKTHHTQFS